jgi:hypothetical protein
MFHPDKLDRLAVDFKITRAGSIIRKGAAALSLIVEATDGALRALAIFSTTLAT